MTYFNQSSIGVLFDLYLFMVVLDRLNYDRANVLAELLTISDYRNLPRVLNRR